MPTRQDTNFAPLTDSDEFESLIRDVCAHEWSDPHTERYGRSGQKQNGVDVYGQPSDLSKAYRGAQCKLRTKGNRLTEREIESEVEDARKFPHSLETLIIATDAPRDTDTQILIDRISERERATGGFCVVIWFWDAITRRLATYPRLIVKYYSDYFANLTTLPVAERLVDSPLQIIVAHLASTERASHLEDLLTLRGIRLIPPERLHPKAATAQLGEVLPDGLLCHCDGLCADDTDQDLVSVANALLVISGRLPVECPIYIIVGDDIKERLLGQIQLLGGNADRYFLLPLTDNFVEPADQIFQRIFDYGHPRRGGLATLDITARTHANAPNVAILDMDWRKWLDIQRFPTPEQWNQLYVPALGCVSQQLVQLGDATRIQINSGLPIPAALALGFHLKLREARIGVWARRRGVSDFKYQFWLSDGGVGDLSYPEIWVKQPAAGSRTAILELTTNHIHEAVSDFATSCNFSPDAWLQLRLENIGSNIEEQHALAFAEQTARATRQLNAQGITDIHLFAQMPSALAVLVGQRLLACGRIHLYWFDNPSYRFAFTMR